MENPKKSKKITKVKKGKKENEKKKKVLVKSKKTKKPKKPKQQKKPSMLELLLLQNQQRQPVGLASQPQIQQPQQMPFNTAMLGTIRDRVSNLQQSSGSVAEEWIKLKAMLNDVKDAYQNGSLDVNDIDELYKQAKKLGKSGFRTYSDLVSTYTTAKEAYEYFVNYLNRNVPQGEREFTRPQPPAPPTPPAPPAQQQPPPPEQSSSEPPPPPAPPVPPAQPRENLPTSNTNWFYDRASEAVNMLAPSTALLAGALGTAHQARQLLSTNRLNRDIVSNSERGGRLANQIQQNAVQGIGTAIAESLPRAGINTLQNLQTRVSSDTERLNEVRERLQASNLVRQQKIAEQEAQRQLRESSRRPNLRESNREQVARQNLGQVENARLNTDLERVDSAGARSERWGEGTRAIRTAEEKAESARKAQRTLQEKEREIEQVRQLQEQLGDIDTRERQMEILERLRPVSSGSSETEALEDRFSNL